MAFPTTGVLDDFNRADSTGLGANWTGIISDPTPNVISNRAGNVANAAAGYNVTTYGPDAEAFADVPVLPGTSSDYVVTLVRISALTATPDAYALRVLNAATNNFLIRRIDAGTGTVIATFTQVVSAGDSVGISAVGSTITAYYKASGGSWVSVGSVGDATYSAAGYVGCQISDTTGRLDNFGGGTVVVAATPSFQYPYMGTRRPMPMFRGPDRDRRGAAMTGKLR